MGYHDSDDIRSFLAEERSLPWHLTFNLRPARGGSAWLSAARTALAAARAADSARPVALPDQRTLPAGDVIALLHLGHFLAPDCGHAEERSPKAA